MLRESQKQRKRKLEKHNVPKFFMVHLQINIVLTVLSLTLLAKHGTSSRFPPPLAAGTEGMNGGKDGGSVI